MTTPFSPTFNNIPLTTQGTQVWAGQPGNSVTFSNLDEENNVFISPLNSVAPFSPNAIQLEPLQTFTGDGGVTYWACSDQTATLLVAGGGIQWQPSPGQIINTAAFATAVAEAIAAAGVGLLANPTVLYQASSVTTEGILVGAHVSETGMGQPDAITAANLFDSYISRPLAVTKQKYFFFDEGVYPSSIPTDWSELAAAGCVMMACFKPSRAAVLAGGSALTTEQGKLAAALTLLAGPALYEVCLWQECDNFTQNNFSDTGNASEPSYQQYWSAYAPTVRTAGIPCVECVINGHTVNLTTGMIPLAGSGGARKPDKVYNDFYATVYEGHSPNTENGAGVSLLNFCQTNNIPFGLGEWGLTSSGTTPTDKWDPYVQVIHDCFDPIVGTSQAADITYYSGDNPNGENIITGPTDFKVPAIQTIYDDYTAIAPDTIPAGGSLILTPVNPSPIGGLAECNALSYEMNLQFSCSGSSTNPFAEVVFDFFEDDGTSGPRVDTVHMVCAMSASSNGARISGKGPLRGQYMRVTVNNLDPTFSCTVSLELLATSRTVSTDKWQEITIYSVPGFTRPTNQTPGTLQLGSETVTVPDNGTPVDILFPMWEGKVWVSLLESGVVAPNLTVNIQPMPVSYWGPPNITNDVPGGANSPVQYFAAVPRSPFRVRFINNGAAPSNVSYALTALEY